MQPELPPVLGLEERPILVPVRQQLPGEGGNRPSTEIRRLDRAVDGVQKAVSERLRLAKVDPDPARKADVAGIHLHRLSNHAMEP